MSNIYQNIVNNSKRNKKLLAILIDPDKMPVNAVKGFISKVNQSIATHVFVGGSEVDAGMTEVLVTEIKKYTDLPVVLFPGDVIQFTDKADGILFLSLISGRNPDYLIGKHVEAVSKLKTATIDVIPTGYLLIENGKETAVQRVSQTKPLKRNNIEMIINTAKAGELLGMKLIYLEAGSGAAHPISSEIISEAKRYLTVPVIVGGGIRSTYQLNRAYSAGADMVVIGTAFENDETLFKELQKENETFLKN